MKCWKCGQEITDGSGTCVYCGASQTRPQPVTEAGRALRVLYDRYGAQEVLGNSAYIVNGLGDLAEDSKKLRSQIRMGLDAGLGRVYLEQLQVGTPDSAFDRRVKVLLTDEAGLNDKTAGEIAGYFDEMIGWKTVQSDTKPEKAPEIHLEKQTETVKTEEKKTADVSEKDVEKTRRCFIYLMIFEAVLNIGPYITANKEFEGAEKVFFIGIIATAVCMLSVLGGKGRGISWLLGMISGFVSTIFAMIVFETFVLMLTETIIDDSVV